ncbi:MAG: hypothetical protein WBA57_21170 [Elainellaceae cyanobacterium]
MKTSIEFETKTFSQNLQQNLRATFDCGALRVKCAPNQGGVKILIQHPPDQEFEDGVLSHVHQILQQLLPEYIDCPPNPDKGQSSMSKIQLYVGLLGKSRPYKAKIISIQKLLQSRHNQTTVKAQPSVPPTFNPFEVAVQDGKTQDITTAQDDTTANSSQMSPVKSVPVETAAVETAPVETAAVETAAAQSVATEPVATASAIAEATPLKSKEPSALVETDTSEQSAPLESAPLVSPSRWKRLKIAVISTLAIATGTLAYGLTRPCVIGSCPIISSAETTGSEALELLQTNPSAESVILAYDHIIEANYTLSSIPFWSEYYDQAQLLLGEFQEDADLVSQIVSAQRLARKASITTQDPPHPTQVWQEVQGQWQEAIALLDDIADRAIVADLVNDKLADYQAQLALVNQRIQQEQNAQEAVISARDAIQMAEARESVARSLESWQLVHVTWQVVINRLDEVSEQTMAYAEAQQLAAIYQPRLTAAYELKLKEELSSSTYNKALAMAEQAINMERRGQWSEAVAHWQYALNSAEQVPQETSYFDPAQSLLNAYGEALGQAEGQATAATAVEQIRPVLDQGCGATPDLCTFATAANEVSIYLGAGYDATVQQMMLAGGVSVSSNYAETSKAATLLRAIANAGDTSQIEVAVYNSSGNLIGTYMPEFQGYVQPQIATTSEQES